MQLVLGSPGFLEQICPLCCIGNREAQSSLRPRTNNHRKKGPPQRIVTDGSLDRQPYGQWIRHNR